MPIAYTDLLSPVGPFEPEFLEDEMNAESGDDPTKTKLQVRIESYIAQGYAKGAALPVDSQDVVALNWALYRLFHQTYLIKSNTPSSETEIQGLGARAFSKAQIEAFETEAQSYLEMYNTAVLEAGAGASADSTSSYSGASSRILFEF